MNKNKYIMQSWKAVCIHKHIISDLSQLCFICTIERKTKIILALKQVDFTYKVFFSTFIYNYRHMFVD